MSVENQDDREKLESFKETIKAAVRLWHNEVASSGVPLETFLIQRRIGKKMQKQWRQTIGDTLYVLNGLTL